MRNRFIILTFALLLAACARPVDVARLPVNTVRVGGADIAYRVAGEGPPLLMLMGYGGTMNAWAPELLTELARKHRVILMDNRGMGLSTPGNEPPTMRRMAKDAVALLNGLNIKKANVFGWSMGTGVAQELALNHPEKIITLILYGASSRRETMEAAIQTIGDFSTVRSFMFPKDWLAANPAIWKKLSKGGLAKPDAIANQRKGIANWQGATHRLHQITAPVLLIVGTEDPLTPPADSLLMAKHLPQAWLTRFKGGGHWLMYQNPQGIALLINTFLNAQPDLLSND